MAVIYDHISDINCASSKRVFKESKHPDLFRYFLVEYLQYGDKGVSHATPVLHFLHDYEH